MFPRRNGGDDRTWRGNLLPAVGPYRGVDVVELPAEVYEEQPPVGSPLPDFAVVLYG